MEVNPNASEGLTNKINKTNQELLNTFLDPNFQKKIIEKIIKLYSNLTESLLGGINTEVKIDVSEISENMIKLAQAVNLYKNSLKTIEEQDLKISQLNQKLSELETKFQELLQKYDQQSLKIMNLESNYENKQTELEQANLLLGDKNNSIGKLKQNIKDLSSYIKILEESNKTLTKNYNKRISYNAVKMNTAMTEKIKEKLGLEIENLLDDNKNKENEIRLLNEENQQYRQEMDNLFLQINSLKSIIEELTIYKNNQTKIDQNEELSDTESTKDLEIKLLKERLFKQKKATKKSETEKHELEQNYTKESIEKELNNKQEIEKLQKQVKELEQKIKEGELLQKIKNAKFVFKGQKYDMPA